MTFFRENQKTIAYWLMGIASIIMVELLLGKYLQIPENLDSGFYMVLIATILTVSGAFIEVKRVEG